MQLTHETLVEIARKWLVKRFPLVVTELATSAGEEADAIAFNGGFSYLIECKASRADFLRDKKKGWRFSGNNRGLGAFRWYLTPKGMVDWRELPEMWGLIEVDAKGKAWERVQPEKYANKTSFVGEMRLLVSLIRRIGQNPPSGVSIRTYKIETQNRATVSIEPRTQNHEGSRHGQD